jgi:hypothetical protein
MTIRYGQSILKIQAFSEKEACEKAFKVCGDHLFPTNNICDDTSIPPDGTIEVSPCEEIQETMTIYDVTMDRIDFKSDANYIIVEVKKAPDISTGNKLWGNDEIQFTRLLAEIYAVSDQEMIEELGISMDLESHEVHELFIRATKKWEFIKEN